MQSMLSCSTVFPSLQPTRSFIAIEMKDGKNPVPAESKACSKPLGMMLITKSPTMMIMRFQGANLVRALVERLLLGRLIATANIREDALSRFATMESTTTRSPSHKNRPTQILQRTLSLMGSVNILC